MLKIGSKYTIKEADFFENHKYWNGHSVAYGVHFTSDMFKYCNKTVTIERSTRSINRGISLIYHIKDDKGSYNWEEWMFKSEKQLELFGE